MTDDQNLQPEQPGEGSAEIPEWVPEKFRSNPEAFGKSYEELESKLTQTSQQLREQQEQFEAYLTQQDEAAQQQQWQAQAPQYQEQLREQFEQDPLAVQSWLAEQAAQRVFSQHIGSQEEAQFALIADAAERQLEAKYDDFDAYKDRIAGRINERGDVYPQSLFRTPQSTAGVLEEIYKTIKYDELASGATTLAQQSEADQRHAKQQAQTLSGAAGRPDAPNDDEEFFASLQAAHEQTWSARMGNA